MVFLCHFGTPILVADRLMGYKENSVEVENNMPGLLKPEAY